MGEKILSILLYPFKWVFFSILKLLSRIFTKIATWIMKKVARIFAWFAIRFKNAMVWSAGDSTKDGVVNFFVSFRPIIILICLGYGAKFFFSSEGLVGQILFLLVPMIAIFINMVLFYSLPTRSTFIPQLYYNMRTVFAVLFVGYTGYLMICYGYDKENIKIIDVVVNYIAIIILGVFPYVLRQYCNFVWDRYKQYLSKEQLRILKSMAVSSPADLIKVRETLKDVDLLEDEIEQKQKNEILEDTNQNKRKIGLGEKILIMSEILIRRGFRSFRGRNVGKKVKKK